MKVQTNKYFLKLKILTIIKKILIFFFICGTMLFTSCTKVSTLLGKNFIPSETSIQLKFDTMDIKTYSILINSLNTSLVDSLNNSLRNSALIGSINDPFFGKVTSGLFTNFIIASGFDSLFHEAEFFDSLVFTLNYNSNYYGDTLDGQTIRIYELEENLFHEQIYYSNQTLAYNPVEIAFHTFLPKPNTKIPMYQNGKTTYLDPQIRINKINSADHPFAKKLLSIKKEDYLMFDTTLNQNVTDYEKFYNYFNGLYITSDFVEDEKSGVLLEINQYTNLTSIKLYKHDTINGLTKDKLNDSIIHKERISTLVINPYNGMSFNNYNHFDYQDAHIDFQEQVLNNNKDLGKERIYLQSLAGTHIRVEFPSIKDLNNLGDKIAVNVAELVFTIDDDINSIFQEPSQLIAEVYVSEDSTSLIPDILRGLNHAGGQLDTANNEYRFRITSYIQEVLDGKNEEELGLEILPSNEQNVYNRVVLFGSNPSSPIPYSKRARLEIKYTIIDQF